MKQCVLDPEKICNDCGDCDVCDINPDKKCDNCGKCLGLDAESRAVIIDDIETE